MSDPRYRTARWQRLRAKVIRRDGRRCSIPGCTADMRAPRMTQVDHIVEVKDGGRFWDEWNLRVVCKPHHDAKTLTVAADRPTVSGGEVVAWNGQRLPATGHWNSKPTGIEQASPNDVLGCDNEKCAWCLEQGYRQ